MWDELSNLLKIYEFIDFFVQQTAYVHCSLETQCFTQLENLYPCHAQSSASPSCENPCCTRPPLEALKLGGRNEKSIVVCKWETLDVFLHLAFGPWASYCGLCAAQMLDYG